MPRIVVSFRWLTYQAAILFVTTLVVPLSACWAQTHPASQPLETPRIPAPTGPYPVGTSIYHLVDSARVDPIADTPGEFREMMVQVWYPAEESSASTRAAYIPDPALLEAMREAEYYGQEAAVIEHWRTVRTHALVDAPLASADGRLPLLLFSHGLGVSRSHYTALLQDLASHGYLIAAVDHPYGGFTALPDGRILTPAADPADLNDPAVIASRTSLWVADASSVLDRLLEANQTLGRFAQYIDTAKVGMFGHSLGGAAALEACLTDTRFKACADMDGAPFGKVEEGGLRRPTLVLGSGPDYSDEDLAARGRTREQWERMGEQYRAIWASIFSIHPTVPGYLVSINGTGHMSYSDAPFVMPETITRFGGRIIEAERGFAIMTTYLRAFFDHYLRGQEHVLFNGPSEAYPEVSIDQPGQ